MNAQTPAFAPIDLATLARHDGIDLFRKMAAGELPGPPIAELLKFTLHSVELGSVVFVGTPDLSVYNPIGTVHGGYAATLLDSAMACSVQTNLKAGKGYTTVELKLNYVRPMTEHTGPVYARGNVISQGRTIATAEGRLEDANGKLLAHGTTTCLIFDLPPSRPLRNSLEQR